MNDAIRSFAIRLAASERIRTGRAIALAQAVLTLITVNKPFGAVDVLRARRP